MDDRVAPALDEEQVAFDVPNRRQAWAAPAVLSMLAVGTILVIFWPTFLSMVAIWWRAETFTHGFLIFPIATYLIWRKRNALTQLAPRPNYGGLLLLAGAGFSWLLAHLTDVLVIQQASVVAMIPALVLTLLGWQAAWAIAFPLAFLFFAVPVGEGLVPPMIDFSAAFTVTLLRLTDIPVYWEGTHFSIPSGDWSVVDACSGVRYLIASVTLGFLYAYLTYRSLWRRLVFVALSAVVPILANGLRAYMIVMIAHLSDMQLAVGVDHLIYGWMFFGLVMLLLFWIDSFWREETLGDQLGDHMAERHAQPVLSKPASANRLTGALIASLLVIGTWPATAAFLEKGRNTPQGPAIIKAPEGTHGWHRVSEPIADWHPVYIGADAEHHALYEKNERMVGLHVAYYRTQRQDADLVNSQNVMVHEKDDRWQQVGQSPITVSVGGRSIPVNQTYLRSRDSRDQRLLVWHWYRIGADHIANPYVAKLIEAKWKLLSGRRDGAGLIIYAEYATKSEEAVPVLREFLSDMLPAIEASLHEAF